MRLTFGSLCLGCIVLCMSSTAQAATRLNNMVTEVVNISKATPGDYHFVVEHDTWLFVRTIGKPAPRVTLDGKSTVLPTPEAMHFVAAGEHAVSLSGSADLLIVRTIPEIQYCSFPYHPWVYRMGPYDWDFLESHINAHVTTMIGSRNRDQSRYADPWRAQGKRWIVQITAPGLSERKAPPVEQIVNELLKPFDDMVYLDGVLIDEYYGSLSMLFEPTIDALRRIGSDPQHASKHIDPFVAGNPARMTGFLKAVFEAGQRVAFEAYNHEQPTEAQAKTYLDGRLSGTLRAYQALYPDANRQTIIALGILSTAPETLNVDPHVNYKVFQDLEFHHLATAPDCKDVSGVMGYTAGYAEEETIRYLGKLYRHYCIEGSTERYNNDPYLLGTVTNADFDDGTTGWAVRPANEGSIEVRNVERFGNMAGRMTRHRGNHCLVMTRSADKPNVVSQTIRNLEPGRLYCLRMYSCNLQPASGYGNPGFDDIHTLRIDIDNAQPMADRSFQHEYLTISPGDSPKMYFNFHFKLFRPNAETAELTISDWKSDTHRFGSIGVETAFNFVEVAPYLEN